MSDTQQTIVDSIMRSRKAVRAFRPDPVARSTLEQILEVAQSAPSNFNTQPWRVYVLVGEAKRRLTEAILKEREASTSGGFSPFPDPPPTDIAARQHDFGRRMYSSVGIDRSDTVARRKYTARNFQFFDAPVGLIFTIDARLQKYSWLDSGCFLQNIMLAAQARGFATCAQVVFANYQSVIVEQLALPEGEDVLCGMSLGYEDDSAPVNHLDVPREPLRTFSTWLGFAD